MAKTLAIIFGIIFVVLSLLAFVSNPLIGPASYFMTGTTYDIIYLLFGIILLIAAGAGEMSSALWLKIIGVLSLIMFVDGLIQASLFGFITAGASDAWLNLILGILLILGGMGKKKSDMAAPMSM